VRVLITGATGFLGRPLVHELVARGHEVAVTVRPHPGTPQAVQAFPTGVAVHEVDLSAPFDGSRLPRVDAVVTLAQERDFRDFPASASKTLEVNVGSNVRIWEWASRTGVAKVVHASSGGIYGSGTGLAFTEDTLPPPHAQNSFYLGTKLCAEIALRSFFPLFGSVVIVRPFFLYGPGQDSDKFVQRLIHNVANGRPVTLGGPDGIRTNPVFVDDAARLFADAIDVGGSFTVNCAGAEIVNLRSLCDLIGRHLGTDPVYVDATNVPDDCLGDTTLQFEVFGAPRVSLDDGIARAVGATPRGPTNA